jgi:hypothetical protein
MDMEEEILAFGETTVWSSAICVVVCARLGLNKAIVEADQANMTILHPLFGGAPFRPTLTVGGL